MVTEVFSEERISDSAANFLSMVTQYLGRESQNVASESELANSHDHKQLNLQFQLKADLA
ncbi:hypothetical protein ACFWEH_36040 [Streptomyces anulatus]|uniref:hypothetical protein n=1 Tax=Streptomyces TaxID=1883 RepID=UPI0011610F4C|nr:hypothetical protein [Streptomyces sp. TSRI0395]